MITHNPTTDVEAVIKHYGNKDGVNIKYCCTTELNVSDQVFDIFYRETPHPEFGNRYFGLHVTPSKAVYITNADIVESFDFGMIKDAKGNYHYSRSHHDFVTIDRSMVDGGRKYIRSGGRLTYFKLINGILEKSE